ncbi:MAG: HAD family hydrolase [Longicatena sp.]
MFKLAAFDIDGTLISREKHVVLESTIIALKKLQANGIRIALASGRPTFALEPSLVEAIKFDYFICSNGTYIIDQSGNDIFKDELSEETVESLSKDIKERDEALFFEFKHNFYIYHGYQRMLSMIEKCYGRVELLKDDRSSTSRHKQELPVSGVAFIKDENVAYFRNKYKAYRFENFMGKYYDIYSYASTKATGIQHLCEKVGIAMSDVVCFGDALNDIAMIQECGCGVAMGDALKEVKEVADYITTKSDEDGIYNACEHLKLI